MAEVESAPESPIAPQPSVGREKSAKIVSNAFSNTEAHLAGFGFCPFCPAASRSLLAFDVDKTVLYQGNPKELEVFRESGLGMTLLKLAKLGFNLAAVTGNSLEQLSTRFMKAMVSELCANKQLELLVNFHFFCNGASLYLWIDPSRDPNFKDVLDRQVDLSPEELLSQANAVLFNERGNVNPAFVVLRYAQKCCISKEDAVKIMDICHDEVEVWWRSVCAAENQISEEVRSRFYIATGDPGKDAELKKELKADPVNTEASLFGPREREPDVGTRSIVGGDGLEYITALNVLPVLSFRHARKQVMPPHADPRIKMISAIQEKMRKQGLVRYIVSPGGRGTIDISHHLVNKRSALTWLVDRLGVEGVDQLGEPFGANCVFFGDEVVVNGNDLPVAEVPGILVFAVNELAERVPFQTNIELPTAFTTQTGPAATHAVLQDILKYCTEKIEAEGVDAWQGESALAGWKEKHMKARLEGKYQQLLARKEPITYRRLESALAVLSLLTRSGEGVDNFADNVIYTVNNLGTVSAHVQEQMFESLSAQGVCRLNRSALRHDEGD